MEKSKNIQEQAKDINFRIEQLKKLKSIILEYEDKLSEALTKDLGRSEFGNYFNEIGFTLHELTDFIKHLKKWTKDEKVSTNWRLLPFSKSWIQKEPLGHVLIIAPWNFPFQLLMSPLIGALASGNRVTLKPSEISEHTALVIKEMFDKHFDSNYVQVELGGREKTQELLEQKFDYIFFTGGEFVGKVVMEAASRHLTPVTLELGGKSPCIVDKTANLDKAASRIIFGKFITNAGQICVAPDYLYVHKEIKNELIQNIKEKLQTYFPNGYETTKDFGRIINERHFERLVRYLDDVEIIFGGNHNKKDKFIEPTLVNATEHSKIMQEEIFGPILPLIEFDNVENIIEKIQEKPKPLALYMFTTNKQFEQQVLENTTSGGVTINDTILHLANPNLPFGGVGTSGFGKYHGKASIDMFSNRKSILRNTNLFEIPSRFPPYTEKSLRLLRKILK